MQTKATGAVTAVNPASQRGPSRIPRYVLVTPARNEASLIEFTIRAVAAQTVLPLRWVIVSDGSTDGPIR